METTNNYDKRKQKKGIRRLDEKEKSEHAFGLETKKEVNIVNGKCVNAVVGVRLNLLIDSGASCNIIDAETWNWCKSRHIKCNSRKVNDKKIYAYGQDKALELLEEFDCNVEIEKRESRATFLVLKGKGRALLGFETATKLEILQIETKISNIHNFEQEQDPIYRGIGKLKDFQLKLPIDKEYPPIAQPVRRIPYKLCEKVEEQIEI